MSQAEVDALIEKLKLQPHPEGGYFRETFRDKETRDGRALSTSIYYLLPAGQESKLHRVDATEIWHFYAGDPLELSIGEDQKNLQSQLLGPNVMAGEIPQIIVPTNHWQAAKPKGKWTLVGCTVSPGFEFSGFEMAN